MIFDWTVNLGHVFTFLGFVGMAYGFLYALRFEVSGLKTDVKSVQLEIEKIGEVMVTLARQEERLNAMDRRLEEVRHGRGFVLDGLPRSVRSDG